MIDGLETVIRQVLVAEIPSLATRLGFQPPDEAWRQRVGAGTGIWLNCALVDLREDRHRRSTEVRVEHDPLRRTHAPYLLRCHYLLSAWNSAKDSAAVPASSQEHGLLGHVVATLVERAPLTPASVLLPTELSGLPAAWREAAFETELLPPEGFPKLPEFWGTMGRTAPWRPAVWLAVTVPIVPEPTPIDGVVTTLLTSFGRGPELEAAETVLDFGGQVVDMANDPVEEALVTLLDQAGRPCARVFTGADGRFVLDDLQPGDYQVTVRAAAHATFPPLSVTVPSPTAGPLQLQLT
ncbi:Pvc16 family protein [Kribbella sp. NPDC055110]